MVVDLHWIARVAQLDRAVVSGTKGCGFESRRAYHFYIFCIYMIYRGL